MSKVFPIESLVGLQATPTSVRIKRQSDQKFYDAVDGVFKAEGDCQSPFVVLLPSVSPNSTGNFEKYITIDPKQFIDGDYIVFFHDTSTPAMTIFDISQVTVFDGDCATRRSPSTTEIAARILDASSTSHTIPGSVGMWMKNVSSQLDAIKVKLGI
jgi:hypothetical protein